MDTNSLIAIIIPIVVIVLGSLVAYLFEKERDRKAKLHERKEDLYKNLVFSIKGFFEEKPDASLRQQFIDEARLARLYACDEAIKALNKLVDIMKESEEAFRKRTGKDYQETAHNLLGEFMRAMRRDLGIKTKLTPDELGRTEIVKGMQ